MCGILSLMGKTSVHEITDLLSLLGHRGQDASGIAWANPSGIDVKKVVGLPRNLKKDFEDLETCAAVGGTRYPTFGQRTANEQVERYSQPFSADTPWGNLILVLNGNITNVSQLTHLKQDYLSDAELLTDTLSQNLTNTSGDLVKSIQDLIGTIDGAYSIAGMWNGISFTFRDPRGIRPLCYGRKKDGTYVVASETIVLDKAGAIFVDNVQPGELITWRKESGEITRHPLRVEKLPHNHCFFEWIYFANPCSNIEGVSVYQVRMMLGELLAKEIAKRKHLSIEYLTPVPDTSRIATQRIAELLNLPIREVILKNRYYSKRVFILNSTEARQEAIKQKYFYVPELIAGKNLLLVDDSIVRGITAQEVLRELKRQGAKNVYLAITSPPIIRPCYYGIDFATDIELIAGNGASLADIEEEIGADEIIYQGIGDMYESIGITDLCMACIDGRYPTSFARELREKIKKGEMPQDSVSYEIDTSSSTK